MEDFSASSTVSSALYVASRVESSLMLAQLFSGPSPLGLATVFYCLRFETSIFVASYELQGYGGGIRLHLHTRVYMWPPGIHAI
jgi:hypothetical protein